MAGATAEQVGVSEFLPTLYCLILGCDLYDTYHLFPEPEISINFTLGFQVDHDFDGFFPMSRPFFY